MQLLAAMSLLWLAVLHPVYTRANTTQQQADGGAPRAAPRRQLQALANAPPGGWPEVTVVNDIAGHFEVPRGLGY